MRCTWPWISGLIACQLGCVARRTQLQDEFAPPEDFQLGQKQQTSADLVDETQFDESSDVEMDHSLIKSSLPLPIKVGRAGSRFNTIPREALAPTASSYHVNRGKSCQLNLITDTVQVDRYLHVANGDLIKMKEGLAAHQTVAINRGTPFHFRLSAKIVIAPLTAKDASNCRSELFGRKTPLGQFHLAATSVALAPSPGSPPMRPTMVAGGGGAETLFIKWDVKASTPKLVDAYDAPVYLESPFYQVAGAHDGFYYLVVHPALKQAKAH